MRLARLGMGLVLAGTLMGPVAHAMNDHTRAAALDKILAGVKGRARKGAETPFAFVSQTVIVSGHPGSTSNGLQPKEA